MMNLFQKKHDWILGGFEFLRADTTVEADPGSGGAIFAVDANGTTLHPYAKMEFGASGAQTPVSASNPLPVVQTGTPSLPTGAATAAKQPALGTAGSSSTDVLSVQGIASGTALPVSAASLPLPSGAATSAKQDTGNASLAAISSQLPAALDGSGNLKVAVISGGSGGTQYAEDTAHASGDLMTMAGAVRRDANTSLVGTDGDIAPLQVNAGGQLKTDGSAVTQPVSDAGGSLTVDSGQLPATLGQKAMAAALAVSLASDQTVIPVNDNGGSLTVDGTVAVSAVTPGTAATSLGKAEDAAHSSGDVGVMALGVRKDADGAFGADLDYGPLQLDDNGYLKVNIKAGAGSGGTAATDDAAFTPGSGSGTPIMGFADEASPDAVDEGDVGVVRMTLNRALHVNLRDASGNELTSGAQYAEDAVHASGDLVTMAGVVRKDTATQLAGTDGDNSVLVNDASGRLHVNVGALPASTNTIETVGDVAHDAAIAGNPLTIGGAASAAAPTDVSADQDAVRAWFLRNGAQAVNLTAAGALLPGDATNGLKVQLAAGTATNEVVGDAAHDAAAAGNPLLQGGYASATAPTDVSADADVVRSWHLRNGAQATVITAGGALIGGDATNGLKVDVTRGTVTDVPATSGGWTSSVLLSAATTNATSLKGSAGQLGGWYLYNANAAVRYLKFYNKATAPTVGTDTPVLVIPIPPGSAANVEFGKGIPFATGLAYALTTGVANSDTGAVAANELVINLFYK